MHCMVYHVPVFKKKIQISEGVEKNNDFAKSTVLNKSNKWNPAEDVLRMEARQWTLRNHLRNKRHYTKQNFNYWEQGLLETRKKRKVSSPTCEEPT